MKMNFLAARDIYHAQISPNNSTITTLPTAAMLYHGVSEPVASGSLTSESPGGGC